MEGDFTRTNFWKKKDLMVYLWYTLVWAGLVMWIPASGSCATKCSVKVAAEGKKAEAKAGKGQPASKKATQKRGKKGKRN